LHSRLSAKGRYDRHTSDAPEPVDHPPQIVVASEIADPSRYSGEARDMDAELRRRVATLPTFWNVQIVGWACFYASAVVTALPELSSGRLWTASAFVLVTFVASCLLRPVCRSLIRRPLSWIGLEVRAFAWSLPSGIAAAFVVGLLTERHAPGWVDWLETAVQASFILFVWCSLYFSLKLWQQSMREQGRLLRAEADLRDARLDALRYQLNPHFLFNSLNAVSTLVLEGEAAAARRMLTQIADFMRTIFDGDPRAETPFSRELAYAEQYLAIEQTRLGARLRVETAIAPQCSDALVPTMLLQPLVENAVRHGIAPLVEGGTIRIASTVVGSLLLISVWNSGSVPKTPSSRSAGRGVGLNNTSARLKTLYGADHVFTSQATASGGWEAVVEVPLHFADPDPGDDVCAS
jgi:two-component system LytT family sensor kinase